MLNLFRNIFGLLKIRISVNKIGAMNETQESANTNQSQSSSIEENNSESIKPRWLNCKICLISGVGFFTVRKIMLMGYFQFLGAFTWQLPMF